MPGEQRAHVEDGVDRDARHADIARHARVVGVVAAVGGEVEGDRKALLPGRQVAAVEGVGVLRGGEPRILTDGPRVGRVHGRIDAAQERREAGVGAGELEIGDVAGVVSPLDRDPLRRFPDRGLQHRTRRGGRSGSLEINRGEIWELAHRARSLNPLIPAQAGTQAFFEPRKTRKARTSLARTRIAAAFSCLFVFFVTRSWGAATTATACMKTPGSPLARG